MAAIAMVGKMTFGLLLGMTTLMEACQVLRDPDGRSACSGSMIPVSLSVFLFFFLSFFFNLKRRSSYIGVLRPVISLILCFAAVVLSQNKLPFVTKT